MTSPCPRRARPPLKHHTFPPVAVQATFFAPAKSPTQRTPSQSRSQSLPAWRQLLWGASKRNAARLIACLVAGTLLLVNLQALSLSGLHTLRALNFAPLLPIHYLEGKKCFVIYLFPELILVCCFFHVNPFLWQQYICNLLPTLFSMPTLPLPQPVLPPMLRQLL